jgi:stage II sporulation protein D
LIICLIQIVTFFIPQNSCSLQKSGQISFASEIAQQPAGFGGGNPVEKYPEKVTIRLFSQKKIKKIKLESGRLSLKSDIKKTDGSRFTISCKDRSGNIFVESGDETKIMNSPVTITSDGIIRTSISGGTPRQFAGTLIIRSTGEQLIILNRINFEDYIAGVVKGEMPGGSGEALAAQAVVARSFALSNRLRHSSEGFDWCDSTHCQYFAGFVEHGSPFSLSAHRTRREVLFAHNRIVEGFYHSTCGGNTSSSVDVYGQFIPGIDGITDAMPGQDKTLCKDSPHFRWSYTISKKELDSMIKKERQLTNTGSLKSLKIIKTDKGGRIISIRIMGENGSFNMSGYDFWQMLGSHLGWGTVESASFLIKDKGNSYEFKGKGLGHGLGMCQYGAIKLGKTGWNYKKILKHYFPKAEIRRM